MQASRLTRGAITKAYHSEASSVDPGTIFQILEVKRIASQSSVGADRYRLVLSDGEFYQQSMLTTSLNHLVTEGSLRDFCVIRCDEAICNKVGARKVIIVIRCAVIDSSSLKEMGNPQNIESPGATQASPYSSSSSSSSSPHGPQSSASSPSSSYPPSSTSSSATPFQASPASGAPAWLRNAPPSSSYSSSSSSAAFGHAVAAVSSAPADYHPISSLNPYQQRWTIKARVTAKSDVRAWTNQKGEGKLFSVDLLDSKGGQIRATMFNDACDKFMQIFQLNQVYTISKGQLKVANKKFSRITNDYELTLNSDAEVHAVADEGVIEAQLFQFVTVEQIRERNENDVIDVIGVVTNLTPVSRIVTKATQKELAKRVLTIVDDTLMQIEVTLWGDQAEKYNESVLPLHSVVALKAVKVSNFGGKGLSASYGAQLFVNPDRRESERLKQWWRSVGSQSFAQGQVPSLTSSVGGGGAGGNQNLESEKRMPLLTIKSEHLGVGQHGKPADFITVRATISIIKADQERPPWYLACPTCNKKVVGGNDGSEARCEKCDMTVAQPQARYILQMMLADPSSTQWVTAFSDHAQALLKMPAGDVKRLMDEHQDDAFRAVFDAPRFTQWIMKLKLVSDTGAQEGGGEVRTRATIVALQPVDFVKETRLLMSEIEQY